MSEKSASSKDMSTVPSSGKDEGDHNASSGAAADSGTTKAAPPKKVDNPPEKMATAGELRRAGRVSLLALILSVLALVGVGLGGWQWWQGQFAYVPAKDNRQVEALTQKVQAIQDQRQSSQDKQAQALASVQSANQSLASRVDTLEQQIDRLQNTVASLAGPRHLARDAALLDQTEVLLQLGKQYYALFQDPARAVKAYAQAEQLLLSVHGVQVKKVISRLNKEQQALEALHPQAYQKNLTRLRKLGEQVQALPLSETPSGQHSAEQPATGFWGKVRAKVSTLVVVERDDKAKGRHRAATRLDRMLLVMNVTRAESAYRAHRVGIGKQRLEDVKGVLENTFDVSDSQVHQAIVLVDQVLSHSNNSDKTVDLGGALAMLRQVQQRKRDRPDSPPEEHPDEDKETSAQADQTKTEAAL